MTWWFDGVLMNALTRKWDATAISSYHEHVKQQQESIPPSIAEEFSLIDAKSTGLLTHVSMMIAGLGLIAPLVADHDLEKGVIVFEMAVYLLVAIGCLRCLTVLNIPRFTKGPLRLAERDRPRNVDPPRTLRRLHPCRHHLYDCGPHYASGNVFLVRAQ